MLFVCDYLKSKKENKRKMYMYVFKPYWASTLKVPKKIQTLIYN